MKTLTIKDIPMTAELSKEAAKTIVGGRIKQREGGEVPPLSEPGGGMGYTGIMIQYTLTVIE